MLANVICLDVGCCSGEIWDRMYTEIILETKLFPIIPDAIFL